MLRLQLKVVTVAAGLVMVLMGPHHAQGQRIHIYNPGVYSSTRTQMSNRAAARAAIKKRWRAKALRRVSPLRRPKVLRRVSPRRSTR